MTVHGMYSYCKSASGVDTSIISYLPCDPGARRLKVSYEYRCAKRVASMNICEAGHALIGKTALPSMSKFLHKKFPLEGNVRAYCRVI